MFTPLHLNCFLSQLLPLYCLLQRQVNQDVEVSAHMRQSLAENMCNVEITNAITSVSYSFWPASEGLNYTGSMRFNCLHAQIFGTCLGNQAFHRRLRLHSQP